MSSVADAEPVRLIKCRPNGNANDIGSVGELRSREAEVVSRFIERFIGRPVFGARGNRVVLRAASPGFVVLGDADGNEVGVCAVRDTSLALEDLLEAGHRPRGFSDRLKTKLGNSAVSHEAGEGGVFGFLRGPELSLGGTLVRVSDPNGIPVYPHAIGIYPETICVDAAVAKSTGRRVIRARPRVGAKARG